MNVPTRSTDGNAYGFEWARGHYARQVLLVVAVAAGAIALRAALAPWVGPRQFYVVGYAAVAVATWIGTWRAGLATSLLFYFAGRLTFGPPEFDSIRFLAFFTTCFIILYFGHRVSVLVDKLRETDRRKTDLLALVAHELQTPLSAMSLSIDLVAPGAVRADKAQAAHRLLGRQIERMRLVVGDLMDMARIEQGNILLQPEPLDLGEVLQQAVADAQAFAGSRQQDLLLESPPSQLMVSADRYRLAQILANLLHNACKFSAPGTSVHVSATADNGNAMIRVRDDGEGIPADKLEAIFEPFVQLQRQRDARPSGLGLGKGSEFTLRLPRLPASHAHPEPKDVAPANVASGGRVLSVLIVDDSVDAGEALQQIVQLDGHNAVAVTEGGAALDAAQAQPPDVVFLDLSLPDMSGFAVAQELRRRGGKQPYIVALSGWDSAADRQQSNEAGCDMHLGKPVSGEVIEETLRKIASRPQEAS